MAWNKGFDFRGTSGGASDPADCTYVLDSGAEAYPVTRNGVTFGWATGVAAGSDRTGASDARLKGINYNSTTGATFQIDLPSSGQYQVWLAAGDAEGGLTSTDEHVIIKDGSTTVLDCGPVNMNFGANNYFDPGLTVRSEATWVAQSAHGGVASASLTFSGTTLNVVITSTSGLWGIAHLFVSQNVATQFLLVRP